MLVCVHVLLLNAKRIFHKLGNERPAFFISHHEVDDSFWRKTIGGSMKIRLVRRPSAAPEIINLQFEKNVVRMRCFANSAEILLKVSMSGKELS